VDLIETLSQVRDVTNDMERLKISKIIRTNPIDEKYELLKYDLARVDTNSDEFKMIQKYKEETRGPTHSVNCEIVNIFSIFEKSCNKRPRKGLRYLLWHGSRLTNWYSILSHGLKIAPPEAPHTGYMFDKGIYTADCFTKSANYCFGTPGQRGLLVLCEVDLGNPREAREADYDSKKFIGPQYQSTKGVGRYVPSSMKPLTGNSEVLIPNGGLVDTMDNDSVVNLSKPNVGNTRGRRSSRLTAIPAATAANGSLLYNEYVVYDVNQVHMKYVVEVEFTRA
jgi:poly [ADP-ribose] polymerase